MAFLFDGFLGNRNWATGEVTCNNKVATVTNAIWKTNGIRETIAWKNNPLNLNRERFGKPLRFLTTF